MHLCNYCFHFLWIISLTNTVYTIRHGQNLIWAQVPSLKNTVSRLVGIEGDPDEWVASGKVRIRHISAPHLGWEFTALAFDYSAQTLIWSEASNKQIQSLTLNGSIGTKDIFTGTSSKVYGLTVDWQSGNLYWTDAMYNWIIMTPLHSSEKWRMYKIIIQTGLDSPHGIAVHEKTGQLFWSDFGERPRIEMADLLGQGRRVLVDDSMEHPRGLTLDDDSIYWVDSLKDTVETVKLDGSGRRVVVSQLGANFFGIANYGKYLFVTEQSKGHLKILDKESGYNYISYRLGYIPYDIVMYTNVSGSNDRCEALQCDQFCIDLPSGASCTCGEGFNMTDEGRTCEQTDVFIQPSHIYAVHDAICRYPANVADMSLVNVTLDKQCFLDKRNGYLALTFDARENFLYYSENNTHTISRIALEVGGTTELLVGGTGIVSGLCLDWITGNLYWTDSNNQVIKVATKHGGHQRDLITANLDFPLGIAVHPGRARIYFTDPGAHPKIEMSYTDGSDRKIIMSDELGSPNHIYIDYNKDVLYWSDSALHHIRSYDLDSERISIIFRQENTGFYGLSLFKDYILWTDRKEMNGLHMARLDKEEKIRGIIHPKYGIAEDLITFDIHNQPLYNNTCEEGQSSCAQLCLNAADDGFRCSCGLGYQLADDERTCTSSVIDDNFLLVTDGYQKQVFQVSSSNGVVHAVNHAIKHIPVAIGFDPMAMKVFWSDNTVNVIKSAGLYEQASHTILAMEKDSVVDGLALDYINRLLYYTDAGHNLVGVVSLTNTVNKKVIVQEGVDEPRAIALLPLEGTFYWTDWGVEPKIERASMDGSDRSTFVTLDQNSWPNGLTLDSKARRLYWVDAQFNTISLIFLNGTGRRIMLQDEKAHYFGITLMGDYLYVTDWKKTYISRMHKNGGSLEIFGTDSFTRLYGIYGFNRTELLTGRGVCSHNDCHHLCLPKPYTYICACREYFTMAEDGRTCIQVNTPPPNTTLVTRTPQTTSSTNAATPFNTKQTMLSSTAAISSMTSSSPSFTTPSKSPVVTKIPVTYKFSTKSTVHTTSISLSTEDTSSAHLSTPSTDWSIPAASVSVSENSLSHGAVAGVVIVVLVALAVAIVVGVVFYRKYRNHKIPHGKLMEDDPKHVDTFYRITFPDNRDEPVLMDGGIENPAYDCLNDDHSPVYNAH